jgi:hypothetical protein
MECDEPFMGLLPNIGSIISFDKWMRSNPPPVVSCAVGARKATLNILKQCGPLIADRESVAEDSGNVESPPQRRTPDQWVRRRRSNNNRSNSRA